MHQSSGRADALHLSYCTAGDMRELKELGNMCDAIRDPKNHAQIGECEAAKYSTTTSLAIHHCFFAL